MARSQSEEQLRTACIHRMGNELGETFAALYREVVSLNAHWNDLLALYGTNENVSLLNETAPAFFMLLEQLYREHFILCLSRLTDPVETQSRGKSHGNLTVQRLLKAVAQAPRGSEIEARLSDAVNAAVAASDSVKKWRNKRIAHLDLDLSVDRSRLSTLPPLTRASLREAIDSLGNVLNLMYAHYFDGAQVGFEHFQSTGNAKALCRHLERSVKYQRRVRACRETGEMPPADPLDWD